jgi:ATP-dependent Clp protease ATP-binding subunit ClpA
VHILTYVLPFRSSGHNYIGSEHLLLGLLREGEGVAARVLESLGADPNNIRTQVDFFAVAFLGQLSFESIIQGVMLTCYPLCRS